MDNNCHILNLLQAFSYVEDNNNQNQGVNKDSQNQRTFTSTVINNN